MTNRKVFFLLVFVVFVLIFSVLTVLFWSFMTDKILVPIYYVFWVCGLLINSVPQGFYLALLVILGITISMRTLSNLPSNQDRQHVIPNQPGADTRYRLWRALFTNAYAYGSRFSKAQLTFEARKLMVSILAFEHGVDPLEVETMVRDGMLDVPPLLRSVIESKYVSDTPPTRLTGLRFWLSRFRRRPDANSDPEINQFLTELTNFVEYHLEVTPHAGNEFES